MMDGVNALLAVFHGFRAAGRLRPERGANALDGGAPWYTTYLTSDDRYVAVGAIEDRFYAILLARLGLSGAGLPDRSDRDGWPALRTILAERFRSRTRDEWAQVFDGSDACVSPVLSLDEAGRHPQAVARRFMTEVAGVRNPSPAPRFSRSEAAIRRPPPRVGEHTREILAEIGAPG